MHVLETPRLRLRRLTTGDAAFIHELVNDPDWLRFIGDRGVRTHDDARDYLARGPLASYDRLGFGLYMTELKEGDIPIGICGLIKRDALDDVDIGFAFLPRYRGCGYAHEAADHTLHYARSVLGLRRVIAITSADNQASIRLLEKLGLRYTRMIQLAGDTEEIKLFAWEGAAP